MRNADETFEYAPPSTPFFPMDTQKKNERTTKARRTQNANENKNDLPTDMSKVKATATTSVVNSPKSSHPTDDKNYSSPEKSESGEEVAETNANENKNDSLPTAEKVKKSG